MKTGVSCSPNDHDKATVKWDIMLIVIDLFHKNRFLVWRKQNQRLPGKWNKLNIRIENDYKKIKHVKPLTWSFTVFQ